MSARAKKITLVGAALVLLWIADWAVHSRFDSSPFFGNATIGATLAQLFSWSRWAVLLGGGAWAFWPVLRKNAKHIAMAVVTTFIFLLLVEVVVVLTGVFGNPEYAALHQRYYQQYVQDTALGFALTPNLKQLTVEDAVRDVRMTINTDDKGFRNTDEDYQTARVAFIGDSFVFGAWVEEEQGFAGLVDAALPTDVLNFGVGGYACEQYNTVLRKWLPQTNVDTVVICFFANDLGRLRHKSWFKNYYANTGTDKYASPTQGIWERTLTHKLIETIDKLGAPNNDFGGSATLENGTMVFKKRGVHPLYFEQGFNQSVEELVADMLRFCQQQGVTPALVMLPSKELVYRTEYEKAFPDNGNYLDIEQQGYARLCEVAQRFNAPCVDVTQAMREAAKTEKLFFDIDGHYNARGHQIVADELLNNLWK